jgi:hypothetical protein
MSLNVGKTRGARKAFCFSSQALRWSSPRRPVQCNCIRDLCFEISRLTQVSVDVLWIGLVIWGRVEGPANFPVAVAVPRVKAVLITQGSTPVYQ